MEISKRLCTICDMAGHGDVVADIGCDHGYVSIRLAENGCFKKVLAMDINKGPLSIAERNIRAKRLTSRIEIRLSDGLKKLAPGEADTVIIAGMGGNLIIKILNDSYDVMKKTKSLILGAQSDIELVRRYLYNNGFCITLEEMVLEDNKYYQLIRAENTADDTVNRFKEMYKMDNRRMFDEFGPYLLTHRDSCMHEYLLLQSNKLEKLLNELRNQSADSNSAERLEQRISEISDELVIMKEGLKMYGDY